MPDGSALFVRDWLPVGIGETQPQACIVILHGLGEHCGRYEILAAFLVERGFAVRTFDHRGHGQSDGTRADLPDPLTIVQDAELLINDFAAQCQTQPILFGHSMGGLFAARIATARTVNLRGLILSSPALALRLSSIDLVLLKIMSVLTPHYAISHSLKPAKLSHDPAPLLTIPTLLLVAGDDALVDPQGSRDFLATLPSNLGKAHFYPDFYHEIFQEVGAAEVFNDLQIWLSSRNFIV